MSFKLHRVYFLLESMKLCMSDLTYIACLGFTVHTFLMTLLPRDASAERGNATVSRLSVRLSVCPSVCPSVRDV